MVSNLKNLLGLLALILQMSLLSGCASLLSDSQFDVRVESLPSQATIVVTDSERNVIAERTTPTVLSLPSRGDGVSPAVYHFNVLQADEPVHEHTLKAYVSPTAYTNILLGAFGLLTGLVDLYTGALYDLPRSVTIDFQKLTR